MYSDDITWLLSNFGVFEGILMGWFHISHPFFTNMSSNAGSYFQVYLMRTWSIFTLPFYHSLRLYYDLCPTNFAKYLHPACWPEYYGPSYLIWLVFRHVTLASPPDAEHWPSPRRLSASAGSPLLSLTSSPSPRPHSTQYTHPPPSLHTVHTGRGANRNSDFAQIPNRNSDGQRRIFWTNWESHYLNLDNMSLKLLDFYKLMGMWAGNLHLCRRHRSTYLTSQSLRNLKII